MTARARSLLPLVACLVALLSLPATAATPTRLAAESRVRIIGKQIVSTWGEGRIRMVNGCTMVFLDKATPEGYSALMLVAVSQLQLQERGQWKAQDVAALLAMEPKECQEEGAD